MNINWLSLFQVLIDSLNIPLFRLGEQFVTPLSLITFGLMLVGTYFVSRYARYVFSARYGERIDSGIEFSVRRFLHYGIMVVGVFFALELVGIDLSSLAFLLAFLGVGIGFGLQNITSNFISGIILLIERPIAVGDLVTVGDEVGTVQRINMRATQVSTVDNLDLIIPNSKFIEENVINWAHGDERIRLRIPVGVAYGTEPETVRDLLLDVADNHDSILQNPEPQVLFEEFADSSLNFELRVWVRNPTERVSIKSELNFAIQRKFAEQDIEMPYPQRDLHLRSPESLRVQTE